MPKRKTNGPVIPTALTHFDALPDSAYVRRPVVLGVLGFSAATLHRRVASGEFPAPHHPSPGTSAWRVGEIRAALAELAK